MEHNNIPQVNNNLPVYKNFIYSVKQDESTDNNSLKSMAHHTDISESANSFFRRDFNWEYFSNELEYE